MTAKVIPYRGSWVEFEYDQKNILQISIDRKRKFPASIFLRALGFEDDTAIISAFYSPVKVKLAGGGEYGLEPGAGIVGAKAKAAVVKPRTKEELVKKGRKIRPADVEAMVKGKVKWVAVGPAEMEGAHAAADVVDPATGEVLIEAAHPLTEEVLAIIESKKIKEIEAVFPSAPTSAPC